MKPGPRGARVYDPRCLLEVPRAHVSPRGVIGLSATGPVIDAHHADHPSTRNKRLANGLSVLPMAHYEQMQDDFGPRITVGCAGENLLLQTDGHWRGQDLGGSLYLETEEGAALRLELVQAASPCIEFARWVLGRTVAPIDEEVRAAMGALGDGCRGFYLRTADTGTVAPGARLLRGRIED